jgi:hypothetical protein
MRQFHPFHLSVVFVIGVVSIAQGTSPPAFTVQSAELDRESSAYFRGASHDGHVAFKTFDDRAWVWSTSGSVRAVTGPESFGVLSGIGPNGVVYFTRHDDYARSVRVHPDGRVDYLELAKSDLYFFDTVPGNISSITPSGRVVGVHRAYARYTNLVVTWEADGVTPTVVPITTPNQFDRYEESRSSDTGRGVGRMNPNQHERSVPAMRDQGVLRPLPMAGRNTGGAHGISRDGRFAVGNALTRLDDFTELPDHAAILWTDEDYTVLPIPYWALQSGASVVNSLGQVVGGVGNDERSAVAFWDSQLNVYELESLLVTDRTMGLYYAYMIDDQGRILVEGWEVIEGLYYDKRFFLTPIPEPAMIGVVAMLGLTLRRVR